MIDLAPAQAAPRITSLRVAYKSHSLRFVFQICDALRHKLNWVHYRTLHHLNS